MEWPQTNHVSDASQQRNARSPRSSCRQEIRQSGRSKSIAAIRNDDQDGNDANERDASWSSFNPTPMHPNPRRRPIHISRAACLGPCFYCADPMADTVGILAYGSLF